MVHSPEASGQVAAVVLAAGRSRRMGHCKLTLPWGKGTVIQQVVETLHVAGARPVVVVTAPPWHRQVSQALTDSPAHVVVYFPKNPNAMLVTLQHGVRHLPEAIQATLVALGDQPHLSPRVARALLETYRATRARLLVPVYRGRRGHPWLLDRSLWPALLHLSPRHTLRDFLHQHASWLHEVPVDEPGLHWDMDTPEDYQRLLRWWQENRSSDLA